MKSHNLLKIIFYLALAVSFHNLTYLAEHMGLIGDEAWVLWIIGQPLVKIISGWTDTGHPYPFYLLIRSLSFLHNHLLTLRYFSIALHFLNLWLIFKLNARQTQKIIFSLCYSLSGYFLILDWQLRQYAIVTTFILLSFIYLKDTKKINLRNILLLTFGMLMDYAYAGFAIPYTLFNLAKKRYHRLGETVLAGLLFLILNPNFFRILPFGQANTAWITQQQHGWLEPGFFLPYLLGTLIHSWFFTSIFFSLALYTFFVIAKKLLTHNPLNTLEIITIYGLIYGVLTWSLSWFTSPIFHYRHIIITGLSLTAATANTISILYYKNTLLIVPAILILFYSHFLAFNRSLSNVSYLGLSIPMDINLPTNLKDNLVGIDTSPAQFPQVDSTAFGYYRRGLLSPPYPFRNIVRNNNATALDCEEITFGSGSILYFNCRETR